VKRATVAAFRPTLAPRPAWALSVMAVMYDTGANCRGFSPQFFSLPPDCLIFHETLNYELIAGSGFHCSKSNQWSEPMRIWTARVSLVALAVTLIAVSAPRAEDQAAKKDIVETAIAAGNFKTLVRAVEVADLVDTLKGKGPFTVFAPTDEAFQKLGEEKINELLKDKKALAKILTYHVVKGNVTSSAVANLDGKGAKTVEGQEVMISVDGKNVMLNGKVKVIKADIKCANGVIHVIDAVLMPPTE
jgi:uncharacterized surface protein with fasciclin (FAS1) repeats